MISSRVGDAKSAEFSSISCFQRGVPLGASSGESLHLERNPSWVEGILEQLPEVVGGMFKIPGNNNKWPSFSCILRLRVAEHGWWFLRPMWEENGRELGWRSGKEEWMCVGNLVGF